MWRLTFIHQIRMHKRLMAGDSVPRKVLLLFSFGFGYIQLSSGSFDYPNSSFWRSEPILTEFFGLTQFIRS